MTEREQIEQSIAVLEDQRGTLGDTVVDTAIGALLEKITTLQEHEPSIEELRKHVTIVFCDLVDFTSMAESLDPETVRDILNAYFAPWRAITSKYGGVIEKFIGDAVMAVFGIPTATERDPENAIRAALTFQEELVHVNHRLSETLGVCLRTRIGVNTGPVVVGELGREGDFTVTGDTVNVASRLQGEAPENGILVSHDTYRHVRGMFDVELLPPIRIKGKSASVSAYTVKKAKPRAFRIQTRGVEGIETRTIGREAELSELKEIWRLVLNDRMFHFVIISGEAGIGKSRLLYDFKNWMELQPKSFWLFQGRSTHQSLNLPYSLVRDMISSRFEIRDTDGSAVIRRKLENGISSFLTSGSDVSEMAHLIGQLLGFDLSESPHLRGIIDDSEQIRNRAYHYLTELFVSAAGSDPVVVYLEDLHWADPGSLDMLDHLRQVNPIQPILLVCTSRPGLFQRYPRWQEEFGFNTKATDSHVRLIKMDSLSRSNTHQLIHEILRLVETIPQPLSELIADRSEGNPFYIEELTKMLIEDGVIIKGAHQWWVAASRLATVSIPPTLTGLLQARLDSLRKPERDALQKASMVGGVFWDGAVAHLSTEQRASSDNLVIDSDDHLAAVRDVLATLCRRELITRRSVSAFENNDEFIFNHALMHDVVYETILKRQRRKYHRHVAEWLLEQSDDRAKQYAGSIAEHFDKAARTEEAIEWYTQAGIHAAGRFANIEALRYLDRALELTPKTAHETHYEILAVREEIHNRQGARESQREDLNALAALAEELRDDRQRAEVYARETVFGNAIGDYSATITAARNTISLAKTSHCPEQEAIASVQWGEALWRRGDYGPAVDQLERSLSLARRVPSSRIEASTLRNLGSVAYYRSQPDRARAYFEQAMKICRSIGDKVGETSALNNLGLVLTQQNRYTEAHESYSQALQLFREMGHRWGEGTSLNNLGMNSDFQRDYCRAVDYYQQALSICHKISNRDGQAMALNNLGFASAHLGMYAEARTYYEQALDISREIHNRTTENNTLNNLGLLFHQTGNDSNALDYLRRALLGAQRRCDPADESSILAYIGHSLTRMGKTDEAREAYDEALSIRRRANVPGLAIEVLTGLGRLALEQGRNAHALSLIEEVLPEVDQLTIAETLDPMYIYLTCYEILTGNKDPRSAKVLKTAYERLQESASKITDEEIKRSFFENVRTHAKLISEWEGLVD